MILSPLYVTRICDELDSGFLQVESNSIPSQDACILVWHGKRFRGGLGFKGSYLRHSENYQTELCRSVHFSI